MKHIIIVCAALLLGATAAHAQYYQPHQPYQIQPIRPIQPIVPQMPQQSWTGNRIGQFDFWQGSNGQGVTCNRIGQMTFCN